ncbi:MAG: hypothetical protein EOM84_03840, partial [Sphingobacteriia bacterium]|nr:hypothetical protein [Sphingobacteriia bacterium]
MSWDTNTYLTANQTITLTGDVTGSGTTSILTALALNSVNGTNIALGSDTQGDIMYYNGTDWVRLAAGTSGYYLQTQGAGANPQWASATAGSSDWTQTRGTPELTYLTDTASDFVIGGNSLATAAFGIDASTALAQIGRDGLAGGLVLYNDTLTTDYTASIFANTTMTSNANFYLPADEPAGTYLLNMTSGGVIGYDTNTYLTSYTETDPIFTAHTAYDIAAGTANNSLLRWDTTAGAWTEETALTIDSSGNLSTTGTIEGLTLTNATDGFTIAGGTTPRTLTITGSDITLNQNLSTTSTPTFGGLTLSNLTPGSIVFAGAGGLISQDNTNFFWDDANNRLGLGDNTPSYQLDINGALGVTDLFRIASNGSDIMTVTDAQTTIYNPVNFASAGDVSMAYDLIMANSSLANIEFNGTGNIFTNSPSQNLNLTLSAANDGQVIVADTLLNDLDLSTTTAGNYYGSNIDVDSTGIFTTGTTNIYGVNSNVTA